MMNARPWSPTARCRSNPFWTAIARIGFFVCLGSPPGTDDFAAAASLPPGIERLESPEAAFRWFDALGYPDFGEAPFVRIATGCGMRWPGLTERNRYWHGFLLDDDADTFRVFVIDSLETRTFTKSPAGTPEHLRVGVETRNLGTYVHERIEDAGRPPETDPYGRPLDRNVEKLSRRAANFVLAWAAWRRGLSPAADRMFEAVARMPDDAATEGQPTVRRKMAEELAYAEMWRAVERAGEANVSRSELCELFRGVAENYPTCSHAARAAETADDLAEMVRQDVEHAEQWIDRPLEQRSSKEQIAEWIFRLRDQNGRQSMLPGRCDVFGTDEGVDDSPAHHLAAFGYEAVPQLIEALDDRRPTRTVECDDFGRFTHRVLTVGRCAEAVLEQIAYRRFDAADDHGKLPTDDHAADTKRRVRAWYADLRRLGEQPTLAAGVEAAGADSARQAVRLIEKYPDDAARSIVAGARRAASLEVREQLVELLADLDGPDILPFLLEEVRGGRQSAYVAAARVLNHRGRPEGVARMLDRWRQVASAPAVWPPEESINSDLDVAAFLLTSNRTAAVRGVLDEMHRVPVDLRLAIVSACVPNYGRRLRLPEAGFPKADHDFDATRVELLMRALEGDEERPEQYFACRGYKRIENPRVCDLAGQILFECDSKRFPFDIDADKARRDEVRHEIVNAWRKETGLPPREVKTSRSTQVAGE